MAVSINLDEKSPEELKRLLDSVKTSNLSVQEKMSGFKRFNPS